MTDKRTFENEMNRICSLVDFDRIKETIYDWFYNSSSDMLEYNDEGMWFLLYDLFNHDYICILEDGTIDSENSNEPIIAEILKGYVGWEICKDVRSCF